jgi:drug/metabolite transporter (DMT)-like permease
VQQKPLFLPYLLLFIGTLCIGWSAIFVELANVPGLTSGFYRVFIAAIVLLPIWFFSNKKNPPFKELILLLFGGVLFALDLNYWNEAILMSSAGISTALANFAPVWVALGAMLFFKTKLNVWYWIGTTIAIAGVIVVIGWQKVQHLEVSKGNLFALIASFFYACYLLVTSKARQKTDTLTFMTFATIGCTITLFISSQIQHVSLQVPMQSWLPLIGLGLITHVAGWLTINYALGYIPSAIASVMLLSQAVWTTLFAIPVLHEYLNTQQIIGGVIVLVGILIVNLKR